MEKDCFTDLTIDGQLYEIITAINDIQITVPTKFDYIEFNPAYTSGVNQYQMAWNDTDGTLELGLKGGNVDLAIGQENVVLVKNDEATTLNKGEVVYISGANGVNLLVKRALANSDITSASTIGVVAETIAHNGQGFICTFGTVKNINTNAFNNGDILYLSPTIAGGITNVKPSAPEHLVLVGFCQKKSGGAGEIFVEIQNGYELNELHNVEIDSLTLANGDVLTYNSTSQTWQNQPSSGGSSTNVQVFAANGTWTKPAGAKSLHVVAIGGGGGGGGGRKSASGTAAFGGGGGAGGAYTERIFDASFAGATETITVGAGGNGGIGATANSFNGTGGVAGGNSSFGSIILVRGGSPGAGGSTGSAAGGASSIGGMFAGSSGGAGQSGTGSSAPNSNAAGAGGGGGGGVSTVPAAAAGGNGGNATSSFPLAIIGGLGGAINSNGGNASSVTASFPAGAPGAGGAGSSITGNAGIGGNAGTYGGGAGGGGAALDGVGNAGNGGIGGNGIVIVTTYF